jgi:hypothetical protein
MNVSNKIKWYVCDIDENDYTPGYCGVEKIPCFLAILHGKPQPLLQNSNNLEIEAWLKRVFQL